MKYILIALCFLGIAGQAQDPDPQLFDTTWYLNELIIDDENSTIPSNDEIEHITIVVYEQNLVASVCLSPAIEIVLDDQFMTIIAFGILAGDVVCQDPDNNTFENLYYFFLFQDGNLPIPIEYEILTDSQGNKELTLTNNNGDQAIYGDVLLGVQNQEEVSFTIATNPVEEVLQLYFSTSLVQATTVIYDVQGRVVNERKAIDGASNTLLQVQNLRKGIYFIEITNGTQRGVKKFIKK